jgi:hypothetical protein
VENDWFSQKVALVNGVSSDWRVWNKGDELELLEKCSEVKRSRNQSVQDVSRINSVLIVP